MKIQIEFNVNDKAEYLEEFLDYINEMSIDDWTVKKYPKKYKKIVEDYV